MNGRVRERCEPCLVHPLARQGARFVPQERPDRFQAHFAFHGSVASPPAPSIGVELDLNCGSGPTAVELET